MAVSFDLKAHDAQFHPDGYVEGKSRCKFRDRIKEYAAVDDLTGSQELVDAMEDSELLEGMLESATDDDVKARLKKMLDDTDGLLANIVKGKGTTQPQAAASASKQPTVTQFGPNKPLEYNKKDFPDKKDALWQDALAHYGDVTYGWKSAGSGSTSPHKISFVGKEYYVKKAGVNPMYDKTAARNEANANNFLRLAGLNAPESMYLKSDDGGRFCISTAADTSGGQLESHLGEAKIAEQVRNAYPIMSLLYNMDILQNADNAFVDKNGDAVFLDNGSTFGFSAQGVRNKRFNFDVRNDPVNGNPDIATLANFRGNNSGINWRKAITGDSSKAVGLDDVLKLAAKYEMGALVREADNKGYLKQLPQNGKDSLMQFADKLDELSAKYKTAKPKAAAPQSQSASTQSAQPQSQSDVAPSAPSASSASAIPMPPSPSAKPAPVTQPKAPAVASAAPINLASVPAKYSVAAQRIARLVNDPSLPQSVRNKYQKMLDRMITNSANQ